MARKSRKRLTVTLPHLHSETAGYIRLSVTGKGGDDSIENQKKVIEAWARENQHPILQYGTANRVAQGKPYSMRNSRVSRCVSSIP